MDKPDAKSGKGPPAAKSKPKENAQAAVVMPVPAGRVVDKSILATEGKDVKESEHAIESNGVSVSVDVPSTAHIFMRCHEGIFYCVAAACFFFIEVYGVALWKPRLAFTVTAANPVAKGLDNYKFAATVIRTLLPPAFGKALGDVLTVYLAPSQLKGRSTWMIKMIIGVLFSLPLSGITFEMQPKKIFPQMIESDLGRFQGLVQTPPNETAIPANRDAWLVRTNVNETILRQSILPPLNQPRGCDLSENQSSNAYVGIAYEFMTNEWQPDMLPTGMDPIETYTVPGSKADPTPTNTNRTSFNVTEAAMVESLFTRGVSLKLDTIAYYAANGISNTTTTSPTQHIQSYARGFFSSMSAWKSLLRTNSSDIGIEYSKFQLSSTINFTAVTLNIPMETTIWHRKLAPVNGSLVEQSTTWPGSGDVEYEIDVANECGPLTCGIQNRGFAPDPTVVAYEVCASAEECVDRTDTSSMWLFGFGRRIEGAALELLALPTNETNPRVRKAVVRNLRE